jgi:hypothetical protein
MHACITCVCVCVCGMAKFYHAGADADLAEEPLAAASHAEGVVDVHVVVLRVRWLLHQRLVDLPADAVHRFKIKHLTSTHTHSSRVYPSAQLSTSPPSPPPTQGE